MKTLITKYPGLLVAVFTLCWAVVEFIGPATGVSAYQVVWTRYGIHLAFMLLVFGPRHRRSLVQTAQPARQIIASLLMLGMPLSFIWALQRMSMQDASVVLWLAPGFVVAISAAMSLPYGGRRTIIAVAIGLVGAMLIFSPDAGVFRRASVLGFAAAFCLALYLIVVRSMTHEKLVTKLFHTAFWVWLALSLGLPSFWQRPTVRGMVAMTAIGMLGWVGLLALDLAVEVMPAGVLAPVLYTQLVWTALVAWLLGQGVPGRRVEVGVLLAVIAALPALLRRSAPSPVDESAEVRAATA